MDCIRARPAIAALALLCLVPSLRAEDAPEAKLKEKGLRRSGTTFVLAAETDVDKKIKEAASIYRLLSQAIMQQQAWAAETANNKAMIVELTQRRILLNQQLPQASSAAQHNQIVSMLNEVTDRMNLLRGQVAGSDRDPEASAQVPRRREALIQAVLDLRQLVDEARQEYTRLNEDPEVKEALAALNAKTRAKLTLGPSKSFLANVKRLEKVEASVQSEVVTMRKERGIFWVEVTFNGKLTKSMAFDTGASSVVLPADFAAQVGLKPSEGDETVQAHVADGSVVEAKKMTVPSMRVGKFTVKDVVCIVMPPDKENVPPLLGQSFHKFFTYNFSPDSGRLVLSKVDTPDEPKHASPKAKPARSKR